MRHLTKITGLLAFASVFLFSLVAFGQPCPPVDVQVINEAAAQQEWWMVLLDALLRLISPIAVAVLTTLVGIAIRKWGKKLDVDTQDRLIGLTDSLIASGITFAEEQGRKALKVGEEQTDGARKLQHAADYINERLEESGLLTVGTERLQRLIEAKLHAERTKPDGIVPSDKEPSDALTVEIPAEDVAAVAAEE